MVLPLVPVIPATASAREGSPKKRSAIAPTLRLKSDYLALVTLGFGEIIPQVFRNGEDINGFNLSNGVKGITLREGDEVVGSGRLAQPQDARRG